MADIQNMDDYSEKTLFMFDLSLYPKYLLWPLLKRGFRAGLILGLTQCRHFYLEPDFPWAELNSAQPCTQDS